MIWRCHQPLSSTATGLFNRMPIVAPMPVGGLVTAAIFVTDIDWANTPFQGQKLVVVNDVKSARITSNENVVRNEKHFYPRVDGASLKGWKETRTGCSIGACSKLALHCVLNIPIVSFVGEDGRLTSGSCHVLAPQAAASRAISSTAMATIVVGRDVYTSQRDAAIIVNDLKAARRPEKCSNHQKIHDNVRISTGNQNQQSNSILQYDLFKNPTKINPKKNKK